MEVCTGFGQIYTMKVTLDDRYLLLGDYQGNLMKYNIDEEYDSSLTNSSPLANKILDGTNFGNVYGGPFNMLVRNLSEVFIAGAGQNNYGLLKCFNF